MRPSLVRPKLPEADKTNNFKLITGAMVYRVNSDNSGRATGVSYYGPDGSENSIEAELVILTTFIYDNTRLLCQTTRSPKRRSIGNHCPPFTRLSLLDLSIFRKPRPILAMFPKTQVHALDAGHFALDTKADEIAALVREFMKAQK